MSVREQSSGENGSAEEIRFLRIPTNKIVRFDDQPRKHFDHAALMGLVASLKHVGQKTPITVTPHPKSRDTYIITDGERRWRAACIIAEETGRPFILNAVVEAVQSKNKKYLSSVIANLHRVDMQPLEVADSLSQLKESGYTYGQLAEIYGKSIAWVQSYLQLNKLCDNVKSLMDPGRSDGDRLKVSSAVEISRIKSPEVQLQVAFEVLEKGLTHNDTVHLIGEASARTPGVVAENRRSRELRPDDEHQVMVDMLRRTHTTSERVLRSLKKIGSNMYSKRINGTADLTHDLNLIDKLSINLDAIREELKKMK